MSALLLGRIAVVSVFAMSLSMIGCSTTGKSIGLGAGIGGGAGMAIGAIADPGKNGEFRTRNVIIGGAVGTMAGMIAGSAIHSSQEKQKAEAFKNGKDSAVVVDPNEQPTLIPAKWRAEVVEQKRIGNRFIPRHTEFVITDPAKWDDGQ